MNFVWTINHSNTTTLCYHPEELFKPERVIFNPPYTICYFPNGNKTIVRCAEDEEFVKEMGVMACIAKRIFESRGEFLRLVESGYDQPEKKKKENKNG